ncbi:MAG: permease-like cell division protein FtsX [Bacteroidetes bacterium]|nr:permease-like cell division protein FtsX [Bacteroidota bacterium]
MSRSFEKFQKRRLISSYISAVVSIGLVLFLLGFLGLILINSKKVADHFKEQIALTIFLKDDARNVEIDQLKQTIGLAPYTKNAVYVSKQQAAEEHSALIGENFMEFLGDNPLKNSIDVFLLAEFVTAEEIENIQNELLENSFVASVNYDKPLIVLLNDNIKKISFWALITSGVFLVIAIVLINNSIRLSVYAKRFTIKTMQLVGATKGFIRAPFVRQSILFGTFGALIALFGLFGVLWALNDYFPELDIVGDIEGHIGLAAFVLGAGIIISGLSTFFATRRFLNLRSDELYY